MHESASISELKDKLFPEDMICPGCSKLKLERHKWFVWGEIFYDASLGEWSYKPNTLKDCQVLCKFCAWGNEIFQSIPENLVGNDHLF